MSCSCVLGMKVSEVVSSLARLVTVQEREPIQSQRTCQTHMTIERRDLRISKP